jgi:hypothetical protein
MNNSSQVQTVLLGQPFVLKTAQSAYIKGAGLTIRLKSISYACKKPSAPQYYTLLELQASGTLEEKQIVQTADREQQSVHFDWKEFSITVFHTADNQTNLKVEDRNKSKK